MVAYNTPLQKLKKRIKRLSAKKSSKKRHPMFASIQDAAYWRKKLIEADELYEELERMIDDMPIAVFADKKAGPLITWMYQELSAFPGRNPQLMIPITNPPDLTAPFGFEPPEERHYLMPWYPTAANKGRFPINPRCVIMEDLYETEFHINGNFKIMREGVLVCAKEDYMLYPEENKDYTVIDEDDEFSPDCSLSF